jgi:hypothetical protein
MTELYGVHHTVTDAILILLRLPKIEEWEYQEWENICADSQKVDEWLSVYESSQLNDEEKLALMTLIVSSYLEGLKNKVDLASFEYKFIPILNANEIIKGKMKFFWNDLFLEDFSEKANLLFR